MTQQEIISVCDELVKKYSGNPRAYFWIIHDLRHNGIIGDELIQAKRYINGKIDEKENQSCAS